MTYRTALILITLAGASAAAHAADYFGDDGSDFDATPLAPSYSVQNDTAQFGVSLGAMYLEGNEYVYDGSHKLSQLIWQSKVPVLRGSLAVKVGNGFSIRADGAAAAYGSSYMEDYDWVGASDADSDWTDRSQHNDTHLDHYFTGSLAGAYDLYNDGLSAVRFNAGVEYTDVKWSAYGGSYTYSTGGGFRNLGGSIADGTPSITYRQQVPGAFGGFDGDVDLGPVRWGGMMRGGFTIYPRYTDDHWLRNLQFVDYIAPAPTFAIGTDVGFKLGQHAEVTLAARYDQIIRQRGRTEVYNTSTGVRTVEPDAGADELHSFQLSAGMRGSF